MSRSKVSDALLEVIERKPIANGLAIIVANVRSVMKEHKDLPGAEKDLYAMVNTFNLLEFATFAILNGTRDDITKSVEAAASFMPGKEYPLCYKRIAFVFSGHGDGKYIYTYESAVDLQYEIYGPLMPKSSPHLANIPKLFFIDACRGLEVDCGIHTPDEPVARGGRSPIIANYLLAYSTLPRMQSFESSSGGYWSQEVAKQLLASEKSVTDVLTEVNGKVLADLKHMPNLQQPVLESTLRQAFSLLKEARELSMIGSEAVSLCNLSLNSEEQEVDSILQSILDAEPQAGNTPFGQQVPTASHSQQQWSNAAAVPPPQQWNPQSQTPYNGGVTANPIPNIPPQHTLETASNYQRYHSAPNAQLPDYQLTVQGGASSSVCLQQAHHTGAGMMYQQGLPPQVYQPNQNVANFSYRPGDAEYNPGAPLNQYGRGETKSSDTQSVQRSFSAPADTCTSEGYFKGQINHYEQKGKIKAVEYSNDVVGQTHKSTVFLTLQNGSEIKGSSQCFYTTLSVAKEEAAKDAIMKLEKQLNDVKYRSRQTASGVSSMTSRGSQGGQVQKIWKSKLKEHFDKTGKPLDAEKIKYKTVEPPKGGFRSKVFVPGLGFAEGEVQRTKSEAEHDAARKALQELQPEQ